jgi:hypothetical protein
MGSIIVGAGAVGSRRVACACLSFDRNIDRVLFPFLMTERNYNSYMAPLRIEATTGLIKSVFYVV